MWSCAVLQKFDQDLLPTNILDLIASEEEERFVLP